MGQPWRVAFALQDDGVAVAERNRLAQAEPDAGVGAGPPHQRLRDAVPVGEAGVNTIYDAEAIREGEQRHKKHGLSMRGRLTDPSTEIAAEYIGEESHTVGANARSVWTIPTQGRPDAHFATFPDALPRRCILAGTSERGVCAACGAPWVRETSGEDRIRTDWLGKGRP